MMVFRKSSIKDNRIAWIDNAKMIAMLFVILGHTARIIHCQAPEWLDSFILSFNMPLFVILSGYTGYNSMVKIKSIHDLLHYTEKITKRILVPSMVFSYMTRFIITIVSNGSFLNMVILETIGIIYCILFIFRKNEIIGKIFQVACWCAIPMALFKSDFWFFKMLWCVQISAATASLIAEHIKNKFYFLCIFAIILSFPMSLLNIMTADFIPYFLIGAILYRYGVFNTLVKIKYLPLIMFSLGVIILYLIGADKYNFWDFHPWDYFTFTQINYLFLRYLSGSLICISIIVWVACLSKSYTKFSEFGGQTLSIYMIHSLIITFLYNLPTKLELTGIQYLFYAFLATALVTIATLFVIKICKKIELTRAFVLGENLF